METQNQYWNQSHLSVWIFFLQDYGFGIGNFGFCLIVSIVASFYCFGVLKEIKNK